LNCLFNKASPDMNMLQVFSPYHDVTQKCNTIMEFVCTVNFQNEIMAVVNGTDLRYAHGMRECRKSKSQE